MEKVKIWAYSTRIKLNRITKVTMSLLLTLLVLGLAAGTASAYASPAPVNLGNASNFAILAQSQITDANPTLSAVTGDVGMSPAAGTSITGLSCTEITGKVWTVDATYPGGWDFNTTCVWPGPGANKTFVDGAVADVLTAITDANGRAVDNTDLTGIAAGQCIAGTCDLTGLTLAPGVYTFTGPGNVVISGDVTLSGTSSDVWIFIIPGTLDISSSKHVNLTGGALAKNVFWSVAGATTLGTTSAFEGNILEAGTPIAIQTGATLHGRALSLFAVTLDGNTVTAPSGTTIPPTPKGSISGMKFNDLNGNGIKDIGEPGLANWTITLTNQSGTVNTVTNANGSYSFTNLSDGNYTVGEILIPGWIQTVPAVSTTGSATYTVNISGGNQVVGQDFGNFNGTVLPKPCRDFVTGGGWIDVKGHKGDKNDKATFGVSGGIINGKFWGQLSYNDHNGVSVKSSSVTAYTVIDNVTRQIKGIARVNGKGSYNYTVVVADNGEPGRNKDSFSLVLSNGYNASGTLKGGNIQLHKECRKPHDDDDKEHYDDKDERDGHKNCDN